MERVRLARARRRVPRRIAITGTRGKSDVTRLVAAGLRASGARVLAKTTGSRPILILPDGSEREIARPGPASIREQIRLVELAASSGAETLVTELMSIGAECLAAESRRILRPSVLAVTNVRLDHLEEMGREKAAVARSLAEAVPCGAEIFIPAEEFYPVFGEAALRRGSRLHPVAGEGDGRRVDGEKDLPPGEFEPNRRLARAVLRSLGVGEPAIDRGFREAAPDPGRLRIWRGMYGRPPRPAVCVALFAANDPESSAAALAKVLAAVPRGGRPLAGLLCLREDRGDRTLQWVEAAGRGFFSDFSSVLLAGPPARAALRLVRRRLGTAGPEVARVKGRTPEDLMSRVLSSLPVEPVVVGLGNFIGPGDEISRYWQSVGAEYDA